MLILVTLGVASVIIGHRRVIRTQKEKMAALQKSEQTLRESEQKYRTLVESMEEAVFVVDVDGNLQFANHYFAWLLNVDPQSLLGTPVHDLIKDTRAEPLFRGLDQVFAKASSQKAEYQWRTTRGDQSFETNLVPQFDESGRVASVLGISRDVTDRKIMEDRLRALVETLREQQKTLKSLSAEVLRAQEEERRRISRELHDEIGQSMTAIDLGLQLVKDSQPRDKKLAALIADCQELVQKTADKIHHFSFELRPAQLDDLGLIPAMKAHARGFTDRTNVPVSFDCDQAIETLEPETKTMLYRIFQEGLTNIAKHAQAKAVTVTIARKPGRIQFTLQDDGVGFDPAVVGHTASGRQRIGLVGMRERAGLFGGRLTIHSQPGEGARIVLELPYDALPEEVEADQHQEA
jgi:PAS domain S-box-containing protein